MADTSGVSSRMAVAVDVSVDRAEVVADLLFQAGASAVAEQIGADGSVTLIADPDIESLGLLTDLGLDPRVVEPESAWNDGWREYARIQRCGRIVIRPAWVASDPAHQAAEVHLAARVSGSADADSDSADAGPDMGGLETVELVMEPGTSFGSGSHVTTRLCVEAVSNRLADGDPPSRVLDVGCGTGVLGVAAALLGAGSITAIDIDAEAVEVTKGLAALNGVASRVDASETPLDQVEGQFDLVLANVLIPVFEELGAQMVDRVEPGGWLVASGLLVEHQARAEAALVGLKLASVASRDGWLVLEFTKPVD